MQFFGGSNSLASRIGVEALVEGLVEALKALLKGIRGAYDDVPPEMRGEILKGLLEEKRGELLSFIRGHLASVDPIAANALMRRHCQRGNYRTSDRGQYNAQSANQLMDALTTLYIALSTGSELDQRVEAFKRLGHLATNDLDAFDAEIEFLRHDVFAKATQRVFDELDRAARVAAREVNRVSNWLETTPPAWRLPANIRWWVIIGTAVLISALVGFGSAF